MSRGSCPTIKPNINKICAADFNRKIKIQFTSSKSNNGPNQNATAAFTDVVTVWAMIKTGRNPSFIEGVNVANSIGVDFFIRYSSAIDFEKEIWIEYSNNKFKVVQVENIDKKNEIVRLGSIEKGKKTINVNLR